MRCPTGPSPRSRTLLTAAKRIALTAIEPNEPVLSSKITGPGQRATLSAMLRDGLKAVTVRVNDVDGVGGFVLPGDRVDVALTRQVDKANASTEVVLQNVRVLAIDQIADERTDKPAVVKAVTLEVDVIGAQKLSLAASVGSLSLMLRKAGEANNEYTRRITLSDLGTPSDAGGADGQTADPDSPPWRCGGRPRARNTACRSKARNFTRPTTGFGSRCATRLRFGEGRNRWAGSSTVNRWKAFRTAADARPHLGRSHDDQTTAARRRACRRPLVANADRGHVDRRGRQPLAAKARRRSGWSRSAQPSAPRR